MKTADQLRKERNDEIAKRAKSGKSSFVHDKAGFLYPIKKKIEKDKEAISKVYKEEQAS